jgi:hypothetical protein
MVTEAGKTEETMVCRDCGGFGADPEGVDCFRCWGVGTEPQADAC